MSSAGFSGAVFKAAQSLPSYSKGIDPNPSLLFYRLNQSEIIFMSEVKVAI